MDTDKEILKLQETVKENNRMLKKIQSRMRWVAFSSIIKWVIYIGIAVGSWYYIQPFVDQLRATISSVQEAGGAVTDLKNSAELGPLFEYFGRE
ncbi:MAG: hypothetical protein ACI9GH_000139 [Candidatus Paceibacteria bacterium]|jgi:hypothetical protein